jgi:hypothetical protein
LLTDRQRHERMKEGLRRVRSLLGAPGASVRAAAAVLEIVSTSTSTSAKATADKNKTAAGGVKSA